VELTSSGQGAAVIGIGADGRWVAPEKFDFEVRIEPLRLLIIGLADAELVEKKTSLATWHEQLGLVAPADGGEGREIKISAASGDVIEHFIVGEDLGVPTVGGKNSFFVRRAGEDQTYIARGDFLIQTDIIEWIERRIVDVDRDRIAGAAIAPADNASFSLSRDAADARNFKIDKVPDGREVLSETSANGVGAVLSNLTFDDVLPLADVDLSGAGKAMYKTFDGLEIDLTVAKKGEDFWVSLKATANPPEPQEAADETGSAAEGDETAVAATPAPPLKSANDVIAEAFLINQQAEKWAYKLPNWKGSLLARDLESLLVPLEVEGEGDAE
jgi:hypothetical protein